MHCHRSPPQEAGKVAMGDLARRFNLSSDLLLPVVTARLGSRIRGRLQGGLLFTPAFIARLKASASRLRHVVALSRAVLHAVATAWCLLCAAATRRHCPTCPHAAADAGNCP